MAVELGGDDDSTGTCTHAVVPKGHQPLEAKWICSCKVNSEGMIIKPMSGLVAEGLSQIL